MKTDFPIPEQTKRVNYTQLYRGLNVGDSVFLDCANNATPAVVSARQAAVRWGWKFRSRKELDGIRIWRLS